MLYYAKQMDNSGDIIALHEFNSDSFPDDTRFIRITQEEYNSLSEAYNPKLQPTDQISDSEALGIILGEVEA